MSGSAQEQPNRTQPCNSTGGKNAPERFDCEMDKPGFRDLGESIIESLCPGIVAFDLDLKIIQANSKARDLIDVGEYIDKSLANGTEKSVWGNWAELLKSVISTEQKGDFETVNYNFNGQKKLLHIVCTPLKETLTQKPIGGAIVIEDVTDKVNIEHQLAQAERLAAIGKVAGKVAHELNNPMDGILRYVNLALRVIDDGKLDKAKEYIHQSRSGLMRMVQIISELLEFSRSTYSAFESVPVDKIIEDAVKSMESSTGQVKVSIICDYKGDPPRVRGGSLFQVFCNLIKNSVDAMDRKGLLRITIGCSGGQLTVQFQDTGPGVLPQDTEKIFEPFFTTKSWGRGTGLGLAICKDIIEKYDGMITAENAPDGGSIFIVQLPTAVEDQSPTG